LGGSGRCDDDMNIRFDLESSRETVALHERFPAVRGAVGVTPTTRGPTRCGGRPSSPGCSKTGIVAVGEIGLDYYRDSRRGNAEDGVQAPVALALDRASPW